MIIKNKRGSSTQSLLKATMINIVSIILLLMFFTTCAIKKDQVNTSNPNFKHLKVFYEDGKYGGWPANWGAWSWGNEILVGFTVADHSGSGGGHTYDRATAMAKFARSNDGGGTWLVEDAYKRGITQATFEHNLGDKSESSKNLMKPINFEHPDFTFTFRAQTLRDGPTSFYYSNNRGKEWNGPFSLTVYFGDRNPAGIVSRTDYIIDGKREMTAFLTVGFRDGEEDWREVSVVRTKDGGQTWKHLAWIGPKKVNSIMPSSIRLDSSNKILTIIRRTDPPEMVSYITEDNGDTWKQLNDPTRIDANGNPPALLQLNDGRLCLIYGVRESDTMAEGIGIYAVFSSDEGQSWSDPVLLRGNDGAAWDIGYARAIQRPDGKVVALYYYNQANNENRPPYRYIAATIFDPDHF